MRRLLVLLLSWLLFAPTQAPAQTNSSTNYDVEILVFDMQLPEFEGSELWTRIPRSTDSTAVRLKGNAPSDTFAAAITAMQMDGRYRVLLHKRWSQPGEPKSERPPVLLATDDDELNGTFRFFLSRFLHVELNLAYQPQRGAIGNYSAESEGQPTFVIDDQQRIKSNELYYFDHPKFGVLVRVSPVSS